MSEPSPGTTSPGASSPTHPPSSPLADRARALATRLLAGRTTRERVHAALLTVILVGLVVHHCVLFWWYVEDTAISFAYARNLVNGEGLVAYPGGERLEGYSNPTWVAILALVQLVGLDPFGATRWIQLAMAIATVPVVYATVREATGKDNDLPLVATAFIAANTQFAVFGGAGLENGLLNLLIAVGFWRMMVELRPGSVEAPHRGRAPWSALVWVLVALTRPEGILYSAVAGFCAMVFSLHARRSIVPTLQWLALFFVPWGAYQAVHLWYFAWPLPNTYYAKLGAREPTTFAWDKKGWKWSRNFFHTMGQGYFLPIWILGVVGDGKWRFVIACVAFTVLGTNIELSQDQRWLLPVVVGSLWAAFWLGLKTTEERPPRWLVVGSTLLAGALVGTSELMRLWNMRPTQIPMPDLVKEAPSIELAAMALLLPLLGVRARGWQLRLLAWTFCVAVTFFALYVQWDWMKGFRWYATAAVPGGILFAFGVDGFVRFVEDMFGLRPSDGEAAERWRPWSIPGTALAVGLVLLQLPANITETKALAEAPDAAPAGIKARVDHVKKLQARLHVDDPWVDLDVDQGAHLWWSDFVMMDIAGLVDLPFAHNGFDRAFVREYVFTERRPHYAHVHGAWATNSKIPTHSEWRRDYVEVPGYGARTLHPGNFVRRDLIVTTDPQPADDATLFDHGIAVYPPLVPSEPGSGRKVYVELRVAAQKPRKGPEDDFRMMLFAADDAGHLASWDAPPGYDWLAPNRWLANETFVGKFDLPIPASLPPGRYDLGIVLLDGAGAVIGLAQGEDAKLGAGAVVAGTGDVPVRFAVGEIVYPGALTVLTVEERGKAAADEREAALALAAGPDHDCEGAEALWKHAYQHRAGEVDWRELHQEAIDRAFAKCWALSSDGVDRDEQVRRLVRAHQFDRWNPEYLARAPIVAASLEADGQAARAAEDWEAAYRLFSDAVAVAPWKAWDRRWAEEARAFRLGTDPASMAVKEAEKEAQRAQAEARRKQAEAERGKAKAKAKAADAGPGGDGAEGGDGGDGAGAEGENP